MWIDVIGYVGMGLVLCSFLMKKVQMIRIVNICGAILSLIYGILTNTIPTAVLNGALIIINGAYLISYLVKKEKRK